MQIHEYVVRHVDGLWQVRFDCRLVSGRPTQMGALDVAQGMAHAGALRGERSRILVSDIDGDPVEFAVIEPAKRQA